MTNELCAIFIGVMVACIIFCLFFNRTIYNGPNSSVIKNNIYTLNNKCYKLVPMIHLCNGGKIFKHA